MFKDADDVQGAHDAARLTVHDDHLKAHVVSDEHALADGELLGDGAGAGAPANLATVLERDTEFYY